MRVNIKFNDDKFKSFSYVICSFIKDQFIYIRGNGKDIKYPLAKIKQFAIYDYD